MSLHAPHVVYVVAAYAVSGLGLAALVLSSLLRARTWRRRAEARIERDPT